jgi:hypothetical protein
MLEVKVVNLKRVKVDTLVVPVCEDAEIHADRTVKSLIDQAKALAGVQGQEGRCRYPFSTGGHRRQPSRFFRARQRRRPDRGILQGFCRKSGEVLH